VFGQQYCILFAKVILMEKYREISCIPPCPEIYVGLYLQNLMESAQHFSVIESAYYSIKWAHSLAGVNNPLC
jgi:hypothetical protein